MALGLHTPRAGEVRPVREPPPPLGPQNVVAPAGRLRERMTNRQVYNMQVMTPELQMYTRINTFRVHVLRMSNMTEEFPYFKEYGKVDVYKVGKLR